MVPLVGIAADADALLLTTCSWVLTTPIEGRLLEVKRTRKHSQDIDFMSAKLVFFILFLIPVQIPVHDCYRKYKQEDICVKAVNEN